MVDTLTCVVKREAGKHPNTKMSKLFMHNFGLVHESNLNMTRKLTLWLLLTLI